MTIQFRPHHFLCTLCFQGKGYSRTFIANYQAIVETLQSTDGDEQSIRVTNTTDSICSPCPHKRNERCATEEKISVLDQAHAHALDLSPNQMITWGQAKQAIKEKISLEIFHQICATCSWKSMGICEEVLNEFLKDRN